MRPIDGPDALSQQLAEMARRAKANRWEAARDHTLLPARGQVAPAGGVERVVFFSGLRVPMSSGSGKPGVK
jgi:hypothetical protein